MSSSRSDCTCPDCDTRSLYKRFTVRGLLWGIFCFPCGLYCCIKTREDFCKECHCEVVKTQPITNTAEMGYQFRNYKSTKTGVPIEHSASYRNAALSIVSNDTTTMSSEGGTEGPRGTSYDSHTELVRPRPS